MTGDLPDDASIHAAPWRVGEAERTFVRDAENQAVIEGAVDGRRSQRQLDVRVVRRVHSVEDASAHREVEVLRAGDVARLGEVPRISAYHGCVVVSAYAIGIE